MAVVDRLVSSVGAALEGVGAVVVPGECLLCGVLLMSPLRWPCCARCVDGLVRIGAPYCPRCGLPYDREVAAGVCGPCRKTGRGFRRARAGFIYEGAVRELVLALKFGGRERIGSMLGAIASQMWCRPGGFEGYAAVVPVPLSRKRQRARGFNQAERIARSVAAHIGLPVRSRLLVKRRDSPPQAGLSAASRRRNVAGSYRARLPRALLGRDLLLVDDVLTTGATADSAARALRRAGAAAVDVLTVARVA